MSPPRDPPPHPGLVLRERYLERFDITETYLAQHIGVSVQTLSQLVQGRRGVTVTTAQGLGAALGTTPEYWLDLQRDYDLWRHPIDRSIAKIWLVREDLPGADESSDEDVDEDVGCGA